MYDAGLPAVMAKVAVPPCVGVPDGCVEAPVDAPVEGELEPPEQAAATIAITMIAVLHTAAERLLEEVPDRVTATPVPGVVAVVVGKRGAGHTRPSRRVNWLAGTLDV